MSKENSDTHSDLTTEQLNNSNIENLYLNILKFYFKNEKFFDGISLISITSALVILCKMIYLDGKNNTSYTDDYLHELIALSLPTMWNFGFHTILRYTSLNKPVVWHQIRNKE